MAITAYIVIELANRQTQVNYDKLKDAKKEFAEYKSRAMKGDTDFLFTFNGMVQTIVDARRVEAISLVDLADYEKRKGTT